MKLMRDKISALSDGKRSSKEIAELLGYSARYVRRVQKRYGLPQLHRGAQPGAKNHQFVCGRRVDLDGYVLVSVKGHPAGRSRPQRHMQVLYEHRLVMEQTLGRYLTHLEAVDHIDGLTLHNSPGNLRLFASNAEHLHTTLGAPLISVKGLANIQERYRRDVTLTPCDTYSLRRARGDVRLRQILRAALKLGIDSPFLLGTHRHLEKAGILLDHQSLERALAELESRYEQDLSR